MWHTEILDRLTTQKTLAQPTHWACSRSPDDNLCARGTASLEHDIANMCLDGSFGDDQCIRNGLIGFALRN